MGNFSQNQVLITSHPQGQQVPKDFKSPEKEEKKYLKT